MVKKKLSYEEEMQVLDGQRIRALEQQAYGDYSYLCDELGVEPEDLAAYERGLLENRMNRKGSLVEINEEAGGLEEVVKEAVVDESKFGDVTRSYLSIEHCRDQGNLKTDSVQQYASWIASAFLDFIQRQNGYGVRIDSRSGVSSGRMNRVWMDALFYEKVVGRGRYKTEYSVGFDEAHDDTDKTKPEDYRQEQLDLLKDLVAKQLPDVNVVVKGNCLYVFKKGMWEINPKLE